MEPEKSIQNNVPEEPKVEATVEEVAMVEEKPVANEMPKGDTVFNDKPKKNGGMILGMILLALLAIGGIGFGVWTMLDGNAQKEQLNSQISSLQQQNGELMDKIEADGRDGGMIIDIDTDSDVDTTDYIYIGEWGIKIKIPEVLKGNISYIFNGGYIEIIGESGFGVDSAVITSGIPYLTMARSKTGEIDFAGCEVSCSSLYATIGGFDYHGMIISGGDLDETVFDGLKEMSQASSFSAI